MHGFGHEEFLAKNPGRRRAEGVSGKLPLGHFEAAIVRNCNMACVGCNHFSPLMRPEFMDVDALHRDLKSILKVAEFWKFAMLGGEPLLHPRIDDMVEMAMSITEVPEIAIVTNGTLLTRMSDRFWRTIKKLEISLYPGKIPPADIQTIERRAAENGITLSIVPQTTFSMSVSGPGQAEDVIQGRFDRCPTGKECFSVDDGYFFKCPQSVLIPKMFLNQDKNVDAIALEGLTVEKLKGFVENRKALQSCSRCSINEQYVPWHEVKPSAWLKASTLK